MAEILRLDNLADNLALSGIALFLDVDGTLLEIAARPQAVSVPQRLRERLCTLSVASGGAVALVSGRAIADLDDPRERARGRRLDPGDGTDRPRRRASARAVRRSAYFDADLVGSSAGFT